MKRIGWILFLLGHALNMFSQVSIEKLSGSYYEITLNGQKMLIDAGCGGRIVSLKSNRHELLLQDSINPINYGSTFWVSPQDWGWPPPAILDRGRYSVRIENNSLMLSSGVDDLMKCKIEKTIHSVVGDTSFVIEYKIINESDIILKYAPWEVTRVPAGGITFFPEGPAGGKRQSKLNIIKHEGIVWFYFDPLLVNDHQKLFYNGKEGWLAHQTNSLLFIKRYPDISYEQEAPGETEVELYINKNRTYMELEIQGEYVSLSPKDTIVWKVCWFLRERQNKIETDDERKNVLSYVRRLVNCEK